jgi:hypothetical protein
VQINPQRKDFFQSKIRGGLLGTHMQ